LSNQTLDGSALTLLDKGLLFAPTKNVYSKQIFIDGQNRLIRSIKIKDFFQVKKTNNNNKPVPFQFDSTWDPPFLLPATQNIITVIEDITNSVIDSQHKDSWGNIKLFQKLNLTPLEKSAINTL
jgi:hypothetical protein